MKCFLFGHTKNLGFSDEPSLVKLKKFLWGDPYFEQYSRQNHVCKDCGSNFSTIKRLDDHTIKMVKRK